MLRASIWGTKWPHFIISAASFVSKLYKGSTLKRINQAAWTRQEYIVDGQDNLKGIPEGLEFPLSSDLEPIDYDKLYAINRHTFPNTCVPQYPKDFQPKTLIQFPILLPFHTSMPNGICHTSLFENEAITFHFSTLVTEEPVITGEIRDRPTIMFPLYRTRVEMIFVSSEELGIEPGPALSISTELSELFDHCLAELNKVITAYIALTKDSDAHKVSREQLPYASIYRIVTLDAWEQAKVGFFLLHAHLIPYEKEPLTPERLNELGRHSWLVANRLNPFIICDELGLTATRYFRRGFYQEAVIYAQLAVETTLSRIFELLLIEGEDKTQTEAEEMEEAIPFMRMVKNEFKPRIGGNWDTRDQSEKVGRWNEKTYKLRNRVIHDGYFPAFEEASDAIDAALALRHYIVDLIKEKEGDYPKLANYFIVRNPK